MSSRGVLHRRSLTMVLGGAITVVAALGALASVVYANTTPQALPLKYRVENSGDYTGRVV